MPDESNMTTEQKAEWLSLVCEIHFLSVLVNMQTEYCVFCNYYGHVDSFSVEIVRDKENYTDRIASTEFYVQYQDAERPWRMSDNADLKAKRDHLKSILETAEIDTSEMSPVKEIVTRYLF